MKRGCKISFRVFFVFLLLSMISVVFHAPASYAAQEHIVRDSTTVLAENQKVDDVVVVSGDADIRGTVHDAVIVINGNTHLYSTAHTDLVITIGGSFTHDRGARVNQVFTLSFDNPLKNNMALGMAIAFGFWACRLALSVALVVLPLLVSILLKKRVHTPLHYIEQSARRTGLIGFLVTICTLAVIGILGVTIVGIPVALLLILVYAVCALIGFSVVSVWISKITISGDEERPVWQKSLIGSIIIMALGNVPLIGPIILIVTTFVSVGIVSLWAWGFLQERKQRKV